MKLDSFDVTGVSTFQVLTKFRNFVSTQQQKSRSSLLKFTKRLVGKVSSFKNSFKIDYRTLSFMYLTKTDIKRVESWMMGF